MALVNCPSCGRQISSFAVTCPHCGFKPGKASAKHAPVLTDSNFFVDLPFISAITGTACFALSLYLITAHFTLDAITVLPYCLLLATVGVAVNWAGACTSVRILSIVCAAFYLVAAVVMLFYAPLWTLPFFLPIGISIWAYFAAAGKEV